MFQRCWNLPSGHCVTGLQWERSGSVVECLTRDRRAAGSSRLFKWYGNLPAGHCLAGVQAVLAVS